jgi:hypothetical protein
VTQRNYGRNPNGENPEWDSSPAQWSYGPADTGNDQDLGAIGMEAPPAREPATYYPTETRKSTRVFLRALVIVVIAVAVAAGAWFVFLA